MKEIILKNGLKVPILGLGTLQADKSKSQVEMLLTAINTGYRHIDTAQMYLNEHDVGAAIKLSGVPRSEFFITTKQKDYHNGDEVAIRQGVLDSMKRLGVDYLDLLLIHWPHHIQKYINTTWRIFEAMYEEGLILAIGVSNFQKHHLIELAKVAKVMPLVNQVELHPGLQQWPLQVYCESIGIKLTSYGPFMKSQIFAEPYEPVLNDIANKHDATIAQVVIAWGMQRGVMMIPKSANFERLQQNFDAIKIVLDEQDMIDIMALNKGRRVYSDPDNNPSFPYF